MIQPITHLFDVGLCCSLLPDLYEAQMELPTEMIRQPPVIVVDTQVGRTYLSHNKKQIINKLINGINLYTS